MTNEDRTAGQERPSDCLDCRRSCDGNGWCDVIIPNEAWNLICPEGGMLCLYCMAVRLETHGLKDVPVAVVSGPYADKNEEWRLIGWQHGHTIGAEETRDALEGRTVDVPEVGSRVVLIHFPDVRGIVTQADERGHARIALDDGDTGHFCARYLVTEAVVTPHQPESAKETES